MSTISKFAGRVVCTKAQFDALTEKDPNKEYLVTDDDTYVIAPSTDGTAGQVLKKTEAGTEWANESGKLYLRTLKCNDYNQGDNMVYITAYSTRQEAFTVDYIKANPNCLKGAVSIVVSNGGDNTSFDRVISTVDAVAIPPEADFAIVTYGSTPIRILTLISDEVIEV